MVNYRGIAIFDKSLGHAPTEKDIALKLYPYASNRKEFASENGVGMKIPWFSDPSSDGNEFGSKLDHVAFDDAFQVKDKPKEVLMKIRSGGVLDKHGLFVQRDDFCMWGSVDSKDQKEGCKSYLEVCNEFKRKRWSDDFYDVFLKDLDPSDWIARFEYHV